MKVSFPLSLKVTVWLLLNLLLLGAAAIAFLVAQGGLSWDSIVAGAPGQRLHELSAAISGEVAAATTEGRSAVLDRFSQAYHADFLLVRNHGTVIAGPALAIPPDVRQRVDEGPLGPPRLLDLPSNDVRPGLRGQRPDGLPRGAPRPGPRGRFLVHTTQPTAWWIGFRVPFPEAGGPPVQATLVVRAHSLWSVILLLNLETWLLVGASVLVLSVLFWLPLVRSITRHLRALTAATGQIADGRFETRVPANRRDELGWLGHSVNSMAARLDTLVNGQKRFLADVAHELGSPIARLQVAVEILESRADPRLRDNVADIHEEVQQMAELVGELLAFTKAGMRAREATLIPVSVDAIFAKVLAREDPDKRVAVTAAPSLMAMADEPLLTRAIGNLVRNALRYAGDAGAISLSARREHDRVAISIEDEGPGVPAAALERLGEAFYRPESARTRETGGVGLGLAIVRSSVAACEGQVQFANRSPRGFRVEIRLKAAG